MSHGFGKAIVSLKQEWDCSSFVVAVEVFIQLWFDFFVYTTHRLVKNKENKVMLIWTLGGKHGPGVIFSRVFIKPLLFLP